MATAATMRAGPAWSIHARSQPTATTTATKPATRGAARRLLWATWACRGGGGGGCGGGGGRGRALRRLPGGAGAGPDVDGDGAPLGALGLEVLALGEREAPGDHVGRERLDLRVVGVDGVVVVLPRVGDAALGAGQLLLQVEEVLVGLQVRVGLGEGEDGLQRPADHVLRLGLVVRALGVDREVAGVD